MAIVRLTDIVTTMKAKWTYGDKFFGYTEEFNDNHNTQYPSLLITPPDSAYPEVTPRNGWEEYSFEVYFSDLYNRTAQQNESIEQRWDNLQDLANEWLDMFLKSYMKGSTGDGTTIAYLMDGSLAIERKKEVANDQLLQLKMNFGYRIFSKCFAPVSNYPNQISDLVSWLRADSNVTFSIPTKKVSAVGDGSGSANGIAQTDKELQPLRYTYGGASEKTRINFNGTTDYLVSDNNCPLTGNDLTIFYVGKVNVITAETQRAIGYRDSQGGGSDRLNFGVNSSNGRIVFKALDDNGNGGGLSSPFLDRGLVNHIACAKINGTDFFVYYNDSPVVTANFATYSNTNGFNLAPFRVGYIESGNVGSYWDGDIQEVIIYNRALSEIEISKVQDYLNKKYRIY